MFRNNTNIIGFLQKKQFFNRSPSPSPSPNSRFATNPIQSRNFTPPKSTKYQTSKTNPRTIPINRNIFELSRQKSVKAEVEHSQKVVDVVLDKPQSKAQQYSNRTFQSSRVEVKMCIQELSSKISVQLRQLEGAITELTVSLQSIFYKKLNELRQELNRNIDQVFVQARNNLNNIITSNNEKHLKKLLKCKHHLSDAERKIKEFKSTLDNDWRKAAGEMFATSFDQKIQQLLQESQQIRKGLEHRVGPSDVPLQQAAVWEAITKNVSGLIERRCR